MGGAAGKMSKLKPYHNWTSDYDEMLRDFALESIVTAI
jgi:hypothetical protein